MPAERISKYWRHREQRMLKPIDPDKIYIKRTENAEDAAGTYRQYVNRYKRTCKSYRWVKQWRWAMREYLPLETRVLEHLAKYIEKAGWTRSDVQTWLSTPNEGLPWAFTPKKCFHFKWIRELEVRIETLLPLEGSTDETEV